MHWDALDPGKINTLAHGKMEPNPAIVPIPLLVDESKATMMFVPSAEYCADKGRGTAGGAGKK